MRPSGEPAAARVERPYCLRCYAPLGRIEAAVVCPRCGHENLKVDQGLYWTQEPGLRRLEGLAKGLIALATLAISLTILLGMRRTASLGTGQGWVAGLPILLSAVLWDTASKITRREPYLRAGLLWSLFLGVFAALLLFVGVGASSGGRPYGPILLGLGAVAALLAVGTPWFARAFERWQLRRILRGQASSERAPATAPH